MLSRLKMMDYFLFLGIITCTILIPGLFFIPESPRWLMGMTEDFEASLQVLRGFDTDISIEVKEIKKSVGTATRRTTVPFADLQRKRDWFPLTVGIGLPILQELSGISCSTVRKSDSYWYVICETMESNNFKSMDDAYAAEPKHNAEDPGQRDIY